MRSGYIVLIQESDGRWREIGQVARKPGVPARLSRRLAVEEAAGERLIDRSFAVIPLSEWRLARDLDID